MRVRWGRVVDSCPLGPSNPLSDRSTAPVREDEKTKVRLADGSLVQARGGSAGIIPVDDDETPNWGLYLDEQWRHRDLAWPCQFVDWTDFELPSDEAELFAAIVEAWDRAKGGATVEIACDGGTGRTGTVVACLAVLSGIPVDEAVAWTRKNYHRWAVEVPEQECMITRFASWWQAVIGRR